MNRATLLFLAFAISLNLVGCTENELSPGPYEEITCPAEPIPVFTGKLNYRQLFGPTRARWYIPMASKRFYVRLAEKLLGHPPKDRTELDMLNVRVRKVITMRISGFGSKSFLEACWPARHLLDVTCVVVSASRGTAARVGARSADTITWTDNTGSLLTVTCEGDYIDWFLFTKTPTVTEDVMDTVLQRISKIGLNPDNVAYYDYKNKMFDPPIGPEWNTTLVSTIDDPAYASGL